MTAANSPETFGAWVRTRRRQLDLTQAELGSRAGCSEAAIRKIEADERKPSRQLAELLALALDVPESERAMFLGVSRGARIEAIRLTPKPHPHNLPALLTATVNRTRDLANVSALLKNETARLVTLVGPPGIGKTRLSIHCGRQVLDGFPDGVWFVDIAELTNPEFFIPTLARSIPPLSLPPSPNLSQLLGGLKDKTALLILDNFEQIVEKSALDVVQILKTCSRVKILVTSRIPLHIYGENEYPLPPLTVPPRDAEHTSDDLMQFESVQLFVARTRQHQPDFDVTPENAPAIIEICTILEGIPLALELAAATQRQMTLKEMVSLLQGQGWVTQIATPARDLPQRQRTLENAIGWSYTLLDDAQKEFFSSLGVFSSWFDTNAASSMCQTSPAQTNELLAALTDHSLLAHENIGGKTHWRMLELIHEYAVGKLAIEKRAQLERRRAEYFLEQIREIKQSTPRDAQEAYFQINFSNFHGALKWAISEQQSEAGFQLIFELYSIWSSLGYFKEGLSLLAQLLALPAPINPEQRARFAQMASDLAWQQHDFESALTYSQQAAELGRIHGLKREYPTYLNRLGRIYIEQGQFAEAREVLNRSLELAHENPAEINPGAPLSQLGEVAFLEGKLDEAQELLNKALTHLADDDDIFLAIAYTDLAEIALAKKEFEKAHGFLTQAFWPAHNQVRRLMVFLTALTGYMLLFPAEDNSKTIEFFGALSGLSESSGVVLARFYVDLNEKRSQSARKQCSPADWDKKFRAGRQWKRNDILAQASLVLRL